ncbi:CNP1-like family protein [Chitiniphilus purpureus]|uniref:CNP1-like family protein n=1 Tax=Chitiniphilus purpureus TaxID=2981137 RepID=A0ABY6DNH3_9NEIS|nr:CNP1-like family protein [Chitiniphilus sp. CD1]UXY15925.1 CNP1-like family protein [Chitiniphilus sp. CD1]
MKKLIALAALFTCATGFASYTGEAGIRPGPVDGDSESVLDRMLGADNPPPPPEQPFTRPELPTLRQWQPYFVNYESRNNAFYLAVDSVSVGPDDIVRYAMAVTPKGGNVKNFRFEGIDCKTKQYRIYAHSIDGASWAESKQQWKRLVKNQRNAFQGALYEDVCTNGYPDKLADITRALLDTRQQPGDCPGCQLRD